MRELIAILVALFASVSPACLAQNLIPNPSFEELIECPPGNFDGPTNKGDIVYAEPWTAIRGTVDLHTTCSAAHPYDHLFWVPYFGGSHQYPRTGENHAGMGINSSPDVIMSPLGHIQEWICTPLAQPLQQDSIYRLSVWVSWRSSFFSPQAVERFGFLLTDTLPPSPQLPSELPVPSAETPAGYQYRDTLGWEEICLTYRANGGESFLTFGYFVPQAEMPEFSGGRKYFMDDFSVTRIPSHLMDPIAVRDTILCTESIEYEIQTQNHHDRYLWSTGDTTATLTVTEPGDYYLEAYSSQTCTVYDTISIRNLSPQGFSLGPDQTLCPEEFPVELSVPTGQESYWWNTGSDQPTTLAPEPGSYWIELDGPCGIVTDTIQLHRLHPEHPLTSVDTILCDSVFSLPIQAVAGFASYEWNNESPQESDQYIATQPGTVRLTASSSCGSYTDSMRITYLPAPSLTMPTVISVCDPSDTVLITGQPYAHSWSTGATSLTIRPQNFGTYTVTVSNACGVDSAMIELMPPEIPLSLSFVATQSIRLGDSIRLDAFVEGTDPIQYRWVPPEGLSCTKCARPVASPVVEMVYQLIATDAYGCEETAVIRLEVDDTPDYFVPNAVSPNGDGLNDRFEFFSGPQIQEVHSLRIYDRWGGLIYEGKGTNPVWKVGSSGTGTYVWVAELLLRNGRRVVVGGDVSVLR